MSFHAHDIALALGSLTALWTVYRKARVLYKPDGRRPLRVLAIAAAGWLAIWWTGAIFGLFEHGEIDVLATVPAIMVLLILESIHAQLEW